MSGLISEIDLIEILATKIRETVSDVLTWTEGQFDVVPRSQPPATGVNAQLPIEICLTVARRRVARLDSSLDLPVAVPSPARRMLDRLAGAF